MVNQKTEKPLVKYDGKWWMLDAVSESGMASIWRNGQPALVPEKVLEYYKGEEKK